MKSRVFSLIIVCLLGALNTDAQSARKAEGSRIVDKTDIIAFHRAILGLKEYAEERNKIPALQKANKVTVKVKAIVDTSGNDNEDDVKTTKLTGYITQQIGDVSVNLYEITYDRSKKKITAVIPTGETADSVGVDKKPTAKTPVAKKAKDAEEDDDEDEKPNKKKDKDSDKDDDN